MYPVDWTESAEQGHGEKERKTVILLRVCMHICMHDVCHSVNS